MVIQTRLHGIYHMPPMPGLASSADSDAIRAPFVAHESHLHGVVVGAQASANVAVVRSQDRAIGDGHGAPHDGSQALTSDWHKLKHGLPESIKQFWVLVTVWRAASHPSRPTIWAGAAQLHHSYLLPGGREPVELWR
jgi:hypothetical protein